MLEEIKFYHGKWLQDELALWSRLTFGKGSNRDLGMMAHLKKEIDELDETLHNKLDQRRMGEELADCALLLFDMAAIHNIDIIKEMRRKFEVNKERTWGKPNPDGSVEHVR